MILGMRIDMQLIFWDLDVNIHNYTYQVLKSQCINNVVTKVYVIVNLPNTRTQRESDVSSEFEPNAGWSRRE